MMKRRFSSYRSPAVLALLLSFLSLPAHSSPLTEEFPPGVRYIPIERIVSEGRVNRTPYSAVIRASAGTDAPPDVWIPSEILRDLQCPVVLRHEKGYFTARISKPAETLDIPALKTLIPGQTAIDIDFRAISGDAGYYFNMTGMESVTGIAAAPVDSSRRIVPAASGDILVVGKVPLMPEKGRFKAGEFAHPELDEPFGLVWDHIIKHHEDISLWGDLPTVRVVSPTWFTLSDESGTIANKAELDYTVAAHGRGWAVWALVSNDFKKERTEKFLADAAAQNAFIARMLVYSRIYDLDGINIDFENVRNEDAAAFTEFVRKFAYAARSIGLKVSVDLPVPSDWSRAYDRETLASIVDYIAVMTYDEHWASSPKAGSTASLPWVQKAIDRTLSQVPGKKLLLGVPFYTREWAETKARGGKISVRAKTMAMASSDARLEETGASLKWLGDVGQNYFEYVSSDKKTYRVWVEDERSIALRLGLVKRFGLAGAAFWRKGFEKDEIWETVGSSLSP
ncbi:MAG: glycoside hydrolase [Synergistaceae bacterium]|jgi:spore germination protein YaaH|nr:glycoside hydrolase [Synergistaceae bacterium]